MTALGDGSARQEQRVADNCWRSRACSFAGHATAMPTGQRAAKTGMTLA